MNTGCLSRSYPLGIPTALPTRGLSGGEWFPRAKEQLASLNSSVLCEYALGGSTCKWDPSGLHCGLAAKYREQMPRPQEPQKGCSGW